jgi:ABC-type nitrate/sulfonate/bicarbonate transport system substrate-binding protein
MFLQSAILLLALMLAIATHAQEQKLEPLIVSYSSFTGNRAPLWIAKDLGLYEKYGLDVKARKHRRRQRIPYRPPRWKRPSHH